MMRKGLKEQDFVHMVQINKDTFENHGSPGEAKVTGPRNFILTIPSPVNHFIVCPTYETLSQGEQGEQHIDCRRTRARYGPRCQPCELGNVVRQHHKVDKETKENLCTVVAYIPKQKKKFRCVIVNLTEVGKPGKN